MMIEIENILDAEKYLDGIQAVIFDLDDTLYSEKEYVKSGYHAIAEAFNDTSLEEKLWNFSQQGRKTLDEVLESKEVIGRKEEAWQIYRFHFPVIHFYPGVREMIERIRENRKIGIITDGRPAGQRNKIKALGLDAMADHIIVTDELGGIEFRKPNQLAFQIMRERMNVPYESMVYIGDNLKRDFISPEKLGMRSIHFLNRDARYYQDP
ncbi:MAG: HAD family hydrolase [Eubacteriales bacterium]|nr:HAD family hydrolase [Eubacteriales bacterium]